MLLEVNIQLSFSAAYSDEWVRKRIRHVQCLGSLQTASKEKAMPAFMFLNTCTHFNMFKLKIFQDSAFGSFVLFFVGFFLCCFLPPPTSFFLFRYSFKCNRKQNLSQMLDTVLWENTVRKYVFNYLFLMEFCGGVEIPHLVFHTKRKWSLLKEIPLCSLILLFSG